MITQQLLDIKQQTALDWRRMLGIGIVMPGPFGVEGLSSKGPTTLHGWEHVNVVGRLSAATGWPVTLDVATDVKLAHLPM